MTVLNARGRSGSRLTAKGTVDSKETPIRLILALIRTKAGLPFAETVALSLGSADFTRSHKTRRVRGFGVAPITKNPAQLSPDNNSAVPAVKGHSVSLSIGKVASLFAELLNSLVTKLVGKGLVAIQALGVSGRMPVKSGTHFKLLSTQGKRQLRRGTGVDSCGLFDDQSNIALKSYSTIPCILGAL